MGSAPGAGASPERLAKALLRKHAPGGIPVPVEDIARGEGASLGWSRHQGPEWGLVMREPSRTTLGVNVNTSARRQRGSLAHALGHLLMHDGSLIVCHAARLGTRGRQASATDAQEAEANAFAIELLMPRDAVAKAVDEFAASRPDGEFPVPRQALEEAIGRKFNVSSEAVACRLVTRGLLAA